MLSSYRALAATALVSLSASSFAAITTYTDSSAFLAALTPPSYTENFDGLGPAGPTSYSGNGFSYDISASSGLYASGDFLGANQPYETLTITFTSGNVMAVGGNFFATNISDMFIATSVLLAIDGGAPEVFMPASASDSFRGFTSTSVITSLTFSVAEVDFQGLYASLDNLTVGTTAVVNRVPEPTSWMLVGLGLAGLAATRRRKA